MTARIQWYNRLAAWLYGVISEPLMDLAVPVWNAEAEEDIEAQWEAEGSGVQRYKERHPERVKEQQDRANAKRREAAREYMHRYATKYVGEGKLPTCRSCGGDVPYDGVGRPRVECPACRGEASTEQEAA